MSAPNREARREWRRFVSAHTRPPVGRATRLSVSSVGPVVAVVAVALTGCGLSASDNHASDNGVASKSPTEVLAATQHAVQGAESVHVTTDTAQGRLKLSLDVAMTTDGSGGTIDLLGLKAELVRAGDTLYIRGEPALYKQLGIKRSIPEDTWVAVPAAHAKQLSAILELRAEVSRLLTTTSTVTVGGRTTVAGEPALELHSAGKLYKGTLYVKTTGQPYPIKLEKQGTEAGETNFSGWDSTSPPPTPTKTIAFAN